MKHFTEEDVRRLLPMSAAIEAMRDAFRQLAGGLAQNQPRRRLKLSTGAVLHAMAGSYGRYFGTKIYSTHPAHGAWFTFHLFDAETGKPLAQIEANYLGQIRTGAVSGLATDLLAPRRELGVGVIGSGFQAGSQLQALAAVRSLGPVSVWSRKEEKRKEFVSALLLKGIRATEAKSASEALTSADVVITATTAKEPVFPDGLVSGPTLILAMGSNDPKRRELPPHLVQSARVVVDDVEAARIEAGDLLLALNAEEWTHVEPLANLVGSESQAIDRLTIFKSVGLGIEDVAAAAVVYEQSLKG